MKILITGSEGTLGRVLKAELRSRGHEVYGWDLAHSSDPYVDRVDVAEARQIDRHAQGLTPDVVYHLAAEFGRVNGAMYPEQLWRTNQIGTRRIIDFCLKTGARLVLAGSSEAYGELYEPAVMVQGEEANPLREDLLDWAAPLHHNEYALSKYTQERQVFIAARNEGLRAIVLRLFNCYGPGEYYNSYRSVVCLFCYRLLFGLPITVYRNYHRVFMWVGDWARTVANVAERFDDLAPTHRELRTGIRKILKATIGEVPPDSGSRPGSVPVYNVGGKEYCSVEHLVGVITENLMIHPAGKLIRLVDKETANVTNKLPDISAAERDLGHDPRVSLAEGIPITIDWMRKVYNTIGGRADEQAATNAALLQFHVIRK